jgi:hypothetical protein
MVEDGNAYCRSGTADNNITYLCGGEAKDDAAYCHGGATKDDAVYQLCIIVAAQQTTTLRNTMVA